MLECVQSVGADVVVCGTRGRGAFARAVLGSTATGLLHHTTVPLLVVPDGTGAIDGPAVAGFDGSEHAEHALEIAARLLPHRRMVIVHAWESEYGRTLVARGLAAGPVDELREIVGLFEAAQRESAQSIAEAGAALAPACADAEGLAQESDAGAWRTIAAAARSLEAGVIVIGSRGLGAARSALLGSGSAGLIHNADLPVLVVPTRAVET